MASVELEKLTKVYPNGFTAVQQLDLTVEEHEFVILVGPSGCGKTTALRMIAGLEEITSGNIRIGGRRVNDVSAKDRDIAMVFQNYALYPHMTVSQNIGFSLKMRKVRKPEIRDRVSSIAKILGLADTLERRPAHLSGGQRQRVAMGRAIVREPTVFLMDEPLSNLDAKLRVQMRAEVTRLQRRLGVATIYVTHDQTEAMTMGDRVAVMRDGLLQQYDQPQALFDRPVNLFVAAFIGSPAMNLYEGRLDETASSVRIGSQDLRLGDEVRRARPGLGGYGGKSVVVGIRPDDLALLNGDSRAATTQVLVGEVDLVEALGAERLIHFNIDAQRVRLEDAQEPDASGLEEGLLELRGEGVARVNSRLPLTAGERAKFAVDPAHVHFFDAQSTLAIR